MENKGILKLAICIALVISLLIIILTAVINEDSNKEDAIKDTSAKEEIESNIDEEQDNISIYNGISGHCFWKNSEGRISSATDFLNMDISTEDKSIELSLEMLGDHTNRSVNACILVFIGGIQHKFYVNGEMCNVYEYVQDDNFVSHIANISIPIDDIVNAYDNTVRVLYVIYDNEIPPVGEKRWYLQTERVMVISDLETQDFKPDEDVEYIQIEGTDFVKLSKWVGYSDINLSNEMIKIDDFEISSEFYRYQMNAKNDKFVSYMIVDNDFELEGICYSMREGFMLKKGIELDKRPHSIMELLIPVDNPELKTDSTYGRIYRVN